MNFIPGFRRVNVYRAVGQDAGSTASLRSRATRASDLSRLIVASPYVGSPYIETGGVCLRSKPRVVPRRPSHGQTLPQIAQQSGGSWIISTGSKWRTWQRGGRDRRCRARSPRPPGGKPAI